MLADILDHSFIQLLGFIGTIITIITGAYAFYRKFLSKDSIPNLSPDINEQPAPVTTEVSSVLERTVLYEKYALVLTLIGIAISAIIIFVSWVSSDDIYSGAFLAILVCVVGCGILLIPVRFLLFFWLRRKFKSWGGGLAGIALLEKQIEERTWYNKAWKRNTRKLLLRAAQGHLI